MNLLALERSPAERFRVGSSSLFLLVVVVEVVLEARAMASPESSLPELAPNS